MTDTPLTDTAATALDRSRIVAGWPLLLAVIVWAIGLPLLPELVPSAAHGVSIAILAALAAIATASGILVLLRMPSDPAALPFVGFTAAVATLLILAPLDQPAHRGGLVAFLLVSPWRYALPPLVVHFALEIGWAHRRERWSAAILGWYAVQLGIFLVVTVGLVIDETPLIDTIDATFRTAVIEPFSVTAATLVLLFALSTPIRGRTLRTPLLWALLLVVVGVLPLVASEFLAEVAWPVVAGISPAVLALVLGPVFGVPAMLTLPFRDPMARDLMAYRLAARFLQGDDLAPALRELAAALHQTFQTRGVAIRLSDPPMRVEIGEIFTHGTISSSTSSVDSTDDVRELIAPLGRSASPLGEVQLAARADGAFGATERDWLTALLQPVTAVLRVRRREIGAERRNAQLATQLSAMLTSLATEATMLPMALVDTRVAVPPPVDAREVLSQLSDGVTSVARHGEGLIASAVDARESARGSSDAVARALDALARLHAEVGEMARHGEDIAASNDVVSGIAFRTNLVANNAALEATRAGSGGRTFGVLAEEVRRLAETTAATSAAIGERTTAMAAAVTEMAATLDGTRHALSAAIRDAEAGEAAAQRLNEAVAELEDTARSLRPAVAEANAVAQRRTARDQHLTSTLERFLTERAELTRALNAHRDVMDRLARSLGQITGESAVPQ
ncbi:MAG TPA: methyl-accepting chemotaxis protein [Gemmatimonadales bacterium]|jgi:hypothetical protein